MNEQDFKKERDETRKSKTVLELLVLERKDVSDYTHSAMIIKIKELERRLNMLYLDEDIQELIEEEYDTILEFLEREHNKMLLTIFSLTPMEMENVAQQFKIYQSSGQIIDRKQFKADEIKVEWYEFFKKKKIVRQFADLINGEEEKFKDSDWIRLFKTLGKNLPDDLKYIYSDPYTADIKFLRYIIHLHYGSIYLQNLKKRLEKICEGDEDNCPYKANAEAYERLKTEGNLNDVTEKNIIIGKPKFTKREPNDNKTSLNQEQTVILIDYLMKENIILSNDTEFQSQGNIAKAFQGLTGYGHDNLRQKLSKVQDLKSNGKQDLREIKKKLEKIISLINNDLGIK